MWGLMYPGKYGACSQGLDPHHILSRGAGGDDALENIITLCRRHHDLVKTGQITQKELRGILHVWYG